MSRHAIQADFYQLSVNGRHLLKASRFSVLPGGQDEYVLSYETVIQQEGECMKEWLV